MALRLHWPDERYTRIYCRDTPDWLALSWDAKGLWAQLNRKADRRGLIDLGRVGRRGVAALVGHPDLWPMLEPALAELEADGCVRVEGAVLEIVDFRAAQESASSGKARTAAWRDKRRGERDETSPEADGDESSPGDDLPPSRDGTSPRSDEASLGDETSQKVTRGYGTAQHGTARKAQHSPPALGDPGAVAPALAGEALSRAFEADLAAETSREDKQRARTLDVLGGRWRTIIEIAEALKRSPRTVEADLHHLRQQGVVERQELGAPGAAPIMHWRRKQRTPATAEGSAEAAG